MRSALTRSRARRSASTRAPKTRRIALHDYELVGEPEVEAGRAVVPAPAG